MFFKRGVNYARVNAPQSKSDSTMKSDVGLAWVLFIFYIISMVASAIIITVYRSRAVNAETELEYMKTLVLKEDDVFPNNSMLYNVSHKKI